MTKVIATPPVEELLGNLSEKTEIHDAGGRLLGYFTPVADSRNEFLEYIRSTYNPEEMKRIKATAGQGGYTTQEVLDHLKSLETP